MRGRAASLVAVLTLAIASLLVALPATAAPTSWSSLVVSRDGATWSASLVHPLFPRQVAWVPGDVMTRTFMARNQSGGPAVLGVRLDRSDGGRGRGGLRVAVSSGQQWVRVSPGDDRPVLQLPLEAGDVGQVRVRVRLDPHSGNGSMARRDPLRIRLSLVPVRPGGAEGEER